MKRKWLLSLFAAAGMIVLPAIAFSAGMLIPKDESLPPLGIEYLRVNATITEGAADTHVEQAFRNTTGRDLEANYVFPLPKGAAIKEFAMYIGGKRMTAELLDAAKAKNIYQDIVRRMKDPALLEYLGGQIFRVNVYPVPAKGLQKIELDYSQAIEFDSGLRRYVFPLRVGEKFSRTLSDFSVAAHITSEIPIGNIYSPSHVISISRKGDNEAVIGFEEEGVTLDRDFSLYYALSEKDFGLSLMAHRTGRDGYFMLMIAPKNVVEESQIVKKDVCFVMDTSGSMAGEKIEQTKAALQFCIASLNKGDRFNIIRFATDVNPFKGSLVEVNDETIGEAKAFVEKMNASGGTDIGSALQQALSVETKEGRPYLIVFLTDGKPTVGMTDEKQIIETIAEKNKGGVRLFVFGAGYNVNTRLLDTLASENKGVTEYVEPKEDIEIKVSRFYAKASNPVLADPDLSFGDKVNTFEVYPKELPDLFKGSQVLVLGKYSGEGDVAVILSGMVNKEKRSFVYETTFPERNEKNDFVERLWATRKVGYLLEQIRLHGEEKELKDEVMRLSKEYGIVTPYTSYLIVEDEARPTPPVARRDLTGVTTYGGEWGGRVIRLHDRSGGAAFAGSGRVADEEMRRRETARYLAVRPPAEEPLAEGVKGPATVLPPGSTESTGAVPILHGAGKSESEESLKSYSLAVSKIAGTVDASVPRKEEGAELSYTFDRIGLGDEMKSIDGDMGVLMSKAVRGLKDAKLDSYGEKAFPLRNINKRNFYNIRGVWVDSEFSEKMPSINVQFASDAYFKLLELKPELKDILTLGEKLIVTVDGKAIFISENVENPVSIEELEKLLKKA
jgi:Ca-activated chloride channel family protein